MTPTASRLQVRLESRMLWFRNEWLFKWHQIKSEHGVKIDSFDGRHISYGGIRFDGSARDVYWHTITRGVRKEVDELFQWIDRDVRTYPRVTAEAAIDECTQLVSSFVATLRHAVVEKDRVLRGNGLDFPALHDAGDWRGLSREDVARRGSDLKIALFPNSQLLEGAPMTMTTRQRSEQFVRTLYAKTGPNRLQHIDYQEIGKDLGWSNDQLRSAADYAIQKNLAKWAAMGGWIEITTQGIDLAERHEQETVGDDRARTEAPVTFTGNVSNSIIQIGRDGAQQSVVASPEAIAALRDLAAQFQPVLAGINDQTEEVATLKAHVASLDAQLHSPAPRKSILLEIAKGIAESLASEGIKHTVVALLPSVPALLEQVFRLLH